MDQIQQQDDRQRNSQQPQCSALQHDILLDPVRHRDRPLHAVARAYALLANPAAYPQLFLRNADGTPGHSAAPLFHNLAGWLLQRENVPLSPDPGPPLTLEAA